MNNHGTINISDYKNSLYNVLNFLANPLSMFFAIPIFISYLGIEMFGIWILINSIISSLRFFDSGIGNSIIKFVSKYRSNDDVLNINKIINNCFFIFSLIIIIVLLISFILINNDAVIRFFNIANNQIHLVREALFYSLILGSIKLFENLVLSILKGYERFDYFAILSVSSRVILIITQIITAIYYASLDKIFLYSCYSSSIFLLLEFVFIKVIIKEIYFSHYLINKKTIKEIYSFGLWSWFYSILSIISIQFDKLIIIKLTNPTILGYYGIAFFIYNNLHSFLSSSVNWLFPKISKLIELKTNVEVIYHKCQLILTLVGISGILLFYVFNESILTYWIDSETYLNTYNYIKLFLIINILNIITIAPYYFLNAGGYVKINTMLKLLGVLLTLFSMILFYYLFDVIGIILARAISPLIIGSISRNYVSSRLFHQYNIYSGFIMLIPILLIISIITIYELNVMNSSLLIVNIALIIISYYYVYYKKIKGIVNV